MPFVFPATKLLERAPLEAEDMSALVWLGNASSDSFTPALSPLGTLHVTSASRLPGAKCAAELRVALGDRQLLLALSEKRHAPLTDCLDFPSSVGIRTVPSLPSYPAELRVAGTPILAHGIVTAGGIHRRHPRTHDLDCCMYMYLFNQNKATSGPTVFPILPRLL